MRKSENMLKRILNARKVSGIIAFFAMIATPGACDEGMYITCIVLVGIFAGCVYLAIRKDDKINRPHALDGKRGL